MALIWKRDILQDLKACGYNTNRIRKEKLLSESTLQKLREGEGLSWSNIETICRLTGYQPGDLMEFVKDE